MDLYWAAIGIGMKFWRYCSNDCSPWFGWVSDFWGPEGVSPDKRSGREVVVRIFYAKRN